MIDHEIISTNKMKIDDDKENDIFTNVVLDKKSTSSIRQPIIIKYDDGLFIEYNKIYCIVLRFSLNGDLFF